MGGGALGSRERLEGNAQRRPPRALPLDRGQQRPARKEAKRHRRGEQPMAMSEESERRDGDADADYKLCEKNVKLRDEEAESGAAQQRRGGNRRDGAHARTWCKTRGDALRSRKHETRNHESLQAKDLFVFFAFRVLVPKRSLYAETAAPLHL